ncbi:hypothetical protein LP421_14775 [Rhizobium sp. RCAM05350]|nr:hypothetical protein LP421_14775 [Rhizobium sp. RCAM05350]
MLSTFIKTHEYKEYIAARRKIDTRTSRCGGFGRYILVALAIAATANTPSLAQSMGDPAPQYSREAMQQALQTREQYDVRGLRFGVAMSTLRPGSNPLLDDIAAALKNFPEWGLRIIGHT